MRRVRLEKLCLTMNCQVERASRRTVPGRFGSDCGKSAPCLSASAFGMAISMVRSSTVEALVRRRPSPFYRMPGVPSGGRNRRTARNATSLLEAIADAVQRLDHLEVLVHELEFLAQPLDMAVDGAVVDIDLIVIGGVHQRIAALHDAWPLRQRLQDQEFGNGQRHRLVL